jgi:hypothetical protein
VGFTIISSCLRKKGNEAQSVKNRMDCIELQIKAMQKDSSKKPGLEITIDFCTYDDKQK